jgi:pyruvate formate lyase activating enzyme
MGECTICNRRSDAISQSLGLCGPCIGAEADPSRERARAVHARSRSEFNLPTQPPRDNADARRCERCVNACRIAPGQVGYCGARSNDGGQLAGGDARGARVRWHHDPLPTNCVADWVCPASGAAGYPTFTDTRGAEVGCQNLAVFYEACSFDCLYCQNWHFKQRSNGRSRHTADDLAHAVTPETRCICFFGGDPSCQVDHSLAAARLARERRGTDILRICWETNGSMSPSALVEMADLSLISGGCIKFDLKAWDDSLHCALCGVSNRRTLANFESLARRRRRQGDPPLLIASTPLVPGYVDADQVAKIAAFIAELDPAIPYALLAFQPAFEMTDLPATTREQARSCLAAAQAAGLRRVRVSGIQNTPHTEGDRPCEY